MKFTTHGNGNGLNDLYCLPDSQVEQNKLWEYINEAGRTAEMVVGDVKGSDWFGKRFIIIPFGECLKQDIKLFIAKAEGE